VVTGGTYDGAAITSVTGAPTLSTTSPYVTSTGITFKSGSNTYTFNSNGGNIFFNGAQAQNVVVASGACYCRGTLVSTDRGEVAIENLRVGDLLLTASGEHLPVRWLGHRRLDITRRDDRTSVWPVLVRAGAFGDGLPRRDLWVSPEHKMVCGDVFIPAYLLLNGQTILQVERDTVEYWHVEVDGHEIILAEGLPSESYVDDGNRGFFHEQDGAVDLHPTLGGSVQNETKLPLVFSGPELTRAKEALLARVALLGHTTTQDDGLHILADGRVIEPVRLGEWRAAFMLPANCTSITLRSNTFVPAHVSAALTDRRTLGAYMNRVQIDGEDLPLGDDDVCAEGWQAFEPQADGLGRRWTNGAIPLPAKSRLVVLDFAGKGLYWSERKHNVVAMVA
jgi:hypothetical protein